MRARDFERRLGPVGGEHPNPLADEDLFERRYVRGLIVDDEQGRRRRGDRRIGRPALGRRRLVKHGRKLSFVRPSVNGLAFGAVRSAARAATKRPEDSEASHREQLETARRTPAELRYRAESRTACRPSASAVHGEKSSIGVGTLQTGLDSVPTLPKPSTAATLTA